MKKLLFFSLIISSSLFAKTRWSSNHIIPDADFVGAGELITRYEMFINSDSTGQVNFTHLAPFEMGFSEWLTLSLGYTDGVTLGFKGRILDEYNKYTPSLAIGVRNLFANEQLARGGVNSRNYDYLGEIYLALSKSVEPIKTRFHLGVSSYPNSSNDQINIQFGVEKYFGNAFYTTLEGWSFADQLNLAIFGTFRVLKSQNLEVAVGLIDIERLFFNSSNEASFSLTPDFSTDPVKPGISLTVAYAIPLSFGSKTQFRDIEDLYQEQEKNMKETRDKVDSLALLLAESSFRADSLSGRVDSLSKVVNSADTIPSFYENILALLISYNNIYNQDIFKPNDAKKISGEIFGYGDDASPALLGVLSIESDENLKLRAISLLGEMKSKDAVPSLLDMLADTRNSRMKIEIISALGNIDDRSVTYAITHLASSADEAVALTAKEILSLWEKSKPEKNIENSENSSEKFVIEPNTSSEKVEENGD